MSNIAILGHPTRGKEIIQLLEMLGGVNKHQIDAIRETYVYFVDIDGIIRLLQISLLRPEQYIIYSLEGFEEKFPYKVGDKVITKDKFIGTITDIRWQGDSFFVGKEEGDIVYTVQVSTTGQITYPKEDLQPYEEENMEERKYTDLRLDVDQDDKLATEVTIDGNKITPPENYLIGKITKVDNGMFVEFVKKQPQYPKDYEECCKVLDIDTQFCMKYLPHGTFSYKEKIIYNLQELIICRDAYWKLAGAEMGLDKPWKPEWNNDDETKFCIYTTQNMISLDIFGVDNRILAFPTSEMRDTFYKNFKDLIEQCKELL